MAPTATSSEVGEGERAWSQEDLVFELQVQNLPRAPRAWDRELKVSSSTLHKGRKVWKRYGLRHKEVNDITTESTDGKLAAETSPRVVKRLCLKQAPIVLPSTHKAKPTQYFATLQERPLSTPRRKICQRRSLIAKDLDASTEVVELKAPAEILDVDGQTSPDLLSPVPDKSQSALAEELGGIATEEAASDVPSSSEYELGISDITDAERILLVDSPSGPQIVCGSSGEHLPHPLLSDKSLLDTFQDGFFKRSDESGHLPTQIAAPASISGSGSAPLITTLAQFDDKPSQQVENEQSDAPNGKRDRSQRSPKQLKHQDIINGQMLDRSPVTRPSAQSPGVSDINSKTFSRNSAGQDIDTENVIINDDAAHMESRHIQAKTTTAHGHRVHERHVHESVARVLLSQEPLVRDGYTVEVPVDLTPIKEQVLVQASAQEVLVAPVPNEDVPVEEAPSLERSTQDIPTQAQPVNIAVQEVPTREVNAQKPPLRSSVLLCETEDRVCPEPIESEAGRSSVCEPNLEIQGGKGEKVKTSFDQSDQCSDDANMLKEFLTRAQARKAAKSQIDLQAPETISTPRRSPRKVLGHLDRNSPSPTKSRNLAHRPGTPPGKALNGVLGGDELDELDSEPIVYRRSGRRVPTAKEPAGAPSFIPVRRPDGADPVVLQKSVAQSLAIVTRANTRRNKGTSKLPKFILEGLASQVAEEVPAKERLTRSTKSVGWDERLVYFQENSTSAMGKGQHAEKRAKGKKVKKVKDLGSPNDTPGRPGKCAAVINGTPATQRRGRSKEIAVAARVQI